ncbi:GH92 family glycosyl hydrolase [Pseudochryseolinea flava]|uniref:Glycoside hydrolase family 92 protein n=1 Tax=Pseudochryseolinea flava TaxID=2059302 RepID=A0A364Y083_9BACT|nr:GH92 family glycosyl hydrolase [Pseudochryseolinea flava]RAW00192.1 glycoside hydrolase family 92 protein [Pseudochryseolinea flava]
MKKIFCAFAFFVSLSIVATTAQDKSVLSYVNPNIGTAHSRWFFYTPAAVPFGMAKLAPSTDGSYGNKQGWEAVGYDSRHNTIEGFACLHEFQVGGFLIAGITGKLQTTPGLLEEPESGYRSRFDKHDEVASPGYYKVKLKDYNVTVELTATSRVGFQKYTFPKSDSAYIILDIGNKLGESGDVKDASVTYLGDGKIEGWVITYPEYVKKYQPGGEVRMYFSGVINKAPYALGTFLKNKQHHGDTTISGVGSGLFLQFKTSASESIEFKAGFSYTSVENARTNLMAEAKDLNFASAKERAEKKWTDELSKIKVTGTDETSKVKFYTGLFHALLGRGLASDVNGQFPQNDGSIGQIPLNKKGVPTFQFYNTDAIWGGNWNLTQLWALAWPEYYNDFVQTQLMVYKNSGWLGDGIANSKFVSGVGTNFTGLAIASAFQSGIKNYDVETAFQAALKNEVGYQARIEGAGKMDLKSFVEQRKIDYVPGWNTTEKGSGFSVSHILEYSYNSYAVAQLAKALGKKKEYEQLLKLSTVWEDYYDDDLDFIRPRVSDGKFLEPFDPLAPWIGFQEGNAYQYTFYVPHTPEKLIARMGEKKFINRLDSIFRVSEKTKFGGADINAFAGLTYVYNHGNQPNLHIAWLFNFTSQPWRTQKWVRTILNDFYGTEHIHGYGYGQDEDQGQLGAWYVMAAIGLFDVKGLVEMNPTFQFGSPLFDKIEISGNKRVTIQVEKQSAESTYLQSVHVNNKKITKNALPLSTLQNGARLKIVLGNTPNESLFQNKSK